MSGVRRDASVRPRFSGALTEWLPAFGASWHVVHVPLNDAGRVTPFGNVCSFRPATPLRTIGLVLKISWPRAMARRARSMRSSVSPSAPPRRSRDHASKIVNARGSNGVLVGFRPTGSLIPMKNGCCESATRPALARRRRAAGRRPRSQTCAVNNPVSKATMSEPFLGRQVESRLRVAKRRVVGLCARSSSTEVDGVDSRPSHMTALRKRRFVDGRGRRYMDAAVRGAPH